MGNFSTFCREEKKVTEKEIGEVIVIHFFVVANDFCDESYVCIFNLLWKENVKNLFGWEKACEQSEGRGDGDFCCFLNLRYAILVLCVLVQ